MVSPSAPSPTDWTKRRRRKKGQPLPGHVGCASISDLGNVPPRAACSASAWTVPTDVSFEFRFSGRTARHNCPPACHFDTISTYPSKYCTVPPKPKWPTAFDRLVLGAPQNYRRRLLPAIFVWCPVRPWRIEGRGVLFWLDPVWSSCLSPAAT